MDNKPATPEKLASLLTPQRLRVVLWAAYGIASLLIACLTFTMVRDLVTSWTITNLPGVSIHEPTPAPGTQGQPAPDVINPVQPIAGPTPPPWNGSDRVSLLIMGLDYRDWAAGEGPPRTDTMILLTIDPVNHTAGILSIPRDLWVNIPGQGNGRINTAYQIGEALKLPGGGPQLATDTVQELLGVPIQYYAQIDFSAFVRFIDELGGVKVDVPEKIKIDPLGDGNTMVLKPGRHTLNGEITLAYVRARKTEGGDFDRAQRQQSVIMAIRRRILEFNMLPTLVAKAPVLYNELSSGVRTNLSLDDAIRLAWLASQIPDNKIKQRAIGSEQVNFVSSPDGEQEVLKPLTEKIRELRDEIFSESGPTGPIAANLEMTDLLKQEGARVAVLNGSLTSGLAARTESYLKSLGVNVVQTGNSDKYAPYTEITFYLGKPYTLKFLVDLMKISELRISHFFDPTSQVDILIVVGDDWAALNIMP